MSEIIVLDYSDAVVHVYHDYNGTNDAEDFLFSEEGFRESEIEWMSAANITFEDHGETSSDVVFRIDEEEVEEMAEKKISPEDMGEILSYIENDEWIWEAIEMAKRDAIEYVLNKV